MILDRQLAAPFGPAALQNDAPARCPHTANEPVNPLAPTCFGLIRSLHQSSLLTRKQAACSSRKPTALYLGQNWPVKKTKPVACRGFPAVNPAPAYPHDGSNYLRCSVVDGTGRLLSLGCPSPPALPRRVTHQPNRTELASLPGDNLCISPLRLPPIVYSQQSSLSKRTRTKQALSLAHRPGKLHIATVTSR